LERIRQVVEKDIRNKGVKRKLRLASRTPPLAVLTIRLPSQRLISQSHSPRFICDVRGAP